MKTKYLALGLCTILALTGCGRRGGTTSSSNNPNQNSLPSVDSSGNFVFDNVKLTYGNPITGADGAHMRKLVADFNKEYEGQINITESYLTETSYYEALELTIPMNRGYDISLIHSYKIASYVNQGLLTPLNEALETSGIDISRDNYLANVYDACVYQENQYGIPLDIHTTLLYYNKDLLDRYNLEVPTNRAELLNACSKMPNNNAEGWGLPLSVEWPSEYIYTTALYQNGGSEYDAEGNPGFNTEEGKAALKSMTDIIHTYKYSPQNVNVDGDLTMFCQGKAMFHIQGDWMLQSVKESGVNFGVTSLSNLFTDKKTETSDDVYARSHVFSIPTNKKLNATKMQACLTFIKYITEHAYIWAESGHIPANNNARNTEEYAKLPYHSSFGDLSSYRLNEPSPYYYEGYSPVFSRVTTALSKADADVDEIFQQAYDEAVDNISMIIEGA